MVVLFSSLVLKPWGFIILHVENILEDNKKTALTKELSTHACDSHSSS